MLAGVSPSFWLCATSSSMLGRRATVAASSTGRSFTGRTARVMLAESVRLPPVPLLPLSSTVTRRESLPK